jgi:exodeoxyribonuclease VII small subunit
MDECDMNDKKDPDKNTDVSQLNYEQAFTELEGVVNKLEHDQSSLEDTIALFERGQKLVERCAELLEKAELRLQTLSEKHLPVEQDEEEE